MSSGSGIGGGQRAQPATSKANSLQQQLSPPGSPALPPFDRQVSTAQPPKIIFEMVQIKALVTLMLVGTSLAAPLTRRQLAGEGAAADSLLTDTDNGVGYGTENAEDNIANTISSITGDSAGNTSGGGSSGSPPPPPPPKGGHKRQLDKVSAGLQAIGNSAGLGDATAPVTSAGESIDGTLTGDAANAGAELGSTEETTLENAGSSVP
ncbi:uncharacterized protein AB675_2949 [Cyphellophora attinorum]|uniref:Uncharacterized protein n=1 Tax=Cyphellophora attinorum TaxID=1664694 RepID=A0A0N1HJ83_9EURO|nr:uncharacterized protein AB675_2949 [Phialophora attinorum]KPI36427.1 hypothetical protein AB675_2949 [Phialophora attinorum]